MGTSGSRPPNTPNEREYSYASNSHVSGGQGVQSMQNAKPQIYSKMDILSKAETPYQIGQGQPGERYSYIPPKDYQPLTREIMGLKEKPVSSKVGGPRVDFAHEVGQHYTPKQQTNYTLKNLSKIFGKQSLAAYEKPASGPIYNIKQYNATYQGGFERGVPTGKGVVHFQDGAYYSGDFVKGQANGHGVYIFPNGSVYQGQFKDCQFNGKGSLIYVDKRMKYEGQFVNGIPQGHGVQTYDEGDRYQGQYNRGTKQGFGTYQWANGLKYQGNWQNGLMHGNGVLLQGTNVVYQGKFEKGMKSGKGVFRTQTGSYHGAFTNDYLEGQGSFLWNDGRLYVGRFSKTMMQDKNGILYYPNGQVATGNWHKNHNKVLETVTNDPSAQNKIKQYKRIHEEGLAYKPNPLLEDLKQSGYVRGSGVNESDMRMRQGFQSDISSEQGVVVNNRSSNVNNSNQVAPLSYDQPRAYNYA